MRHADRLIDLAYGSLSGSEGHRDLVAGLATAFKSHLIATQLEGSDHRHSPLTHYDELGRKCAELDSKVLSPEIENPWFAAGAAERLMKFGVASDTGLIESAKLRKSAFFDLVIKPLDVFHSLGFLLSGKPGPISVLTLSRSARQGQFQSRELALAHHLAPHLRSLCQIQASLALGRITMPTARPFWVLDSTGRIVNSEEHAAATEVLDERDNRLLPVYSADREPMQEALQRISSGSALQARVLLRNKHGTPTALAKLHHVRLPLFLTWTLSGVPSILVVVRPIAPSASDLAPILRLTFGLTSAECRVALLLHQTESARELAQVSGRSEETIRSQLKAIYSKTGVSSQLQLLRLMDRLAAE